jgi:hypothetical protein
MSSEKNSLGRNQSIAAGACSVAVVAAFAGIKSTSPEDAVAKKQSREQRMRWFAASFQYRKCGKRSGASRANSLQLPPCRAWTGSMSRRSARVPQQR